MSGPVCFAIAGWKNSGKTTLVAGLVQEFGSRGLVVSTIKHAHHAFDLDTKGTDSFRHREAGAQEVAMVSSNRWAIQHELAGKPEPHLQDILAKLSPCDVVIIEGYKSEPIPKIEIIGNDAHERQLWKDDENVIAVASDNAIKDCPLPVFARHQHSELADFLITHLGIRT